MESRGGSGQLPETHGDIRRQELLGENWLAASKASDVPSRVRNRDGTGLEPKCLGGNARFCLVAAL